MSLTRSVAALEPSADQPPAGGVPSFAELYEAHFSFVWRMLLRLGVHRENAADATQDVFVVVGRRLPDLHSPEVSRSWIYGIVVRVAYEYRRAQLRSAGERTEPDLLLDPNARDALDTVERAQELELLDRLLNGLTADKREVLVLVELEQLSVPEVAKLTGLNSNTIYTRLRAARAAFNEAIARHRARTRNQP